MHALDAFQALHVIALYQFDVKCHVISAWIQEQRLSVADFDVKAECRYGGSAKAGALGFGDLGVLLLKTCTEVRKTCVMQQTSLKS